MPASEARVQREGDALVFSGALDRAACTRLWANATQVLAGTQRLVANIVPQPVIDDLEFVQIEHQTR